MQMSNGLDRSSFSAIGYGEARFILRLVLPVNLSNFSQRVVVVVFGSWSELSWTYGGLDLPS